MINKQANVQTLLDSDLWKDMETHVLDDTLGAFVNGVAHYECVMPSWVGIGNMACYMLPRIVYNLAVMGAVSVDKNDTATITKLATVLQEALKDGINDGLKDEIRDKPINTSPKGG